MRSRLRLVVAAFVAGVLFAACGNSQEVNPEEQLISRAEEAIEALHLGDWQRLSELVHPEHGLLLSPYAYVELDEAVVLSPGEVRAIESDDSLRMFGYTDGEGAPIEKTTKAFITDWLLDRDFTSVQRGQPGEVIGRGNTLNNVPEAFIEESEGQRNADRINFVEYHDPGSDEWEGMDWASLRLVFEYENDDWNLIGIVRDQWTI
jgi:hypothetical protein